MKIRIPLPLNPTYYQLLGKEDNVKYLVKSALEVKKCKVEFKVEQEPVEWVKEVLDDLVQLFQKTETGYTFVFAMATQFTEGKSLKSVANFGEQVFFEFTD